MITGAGDQARFLFSVAGFDVLGFTGTETMGELFQFEIELVTASTALDWDNLVGQDAVLTILGPRGTSRHVSGIISRFDLVKVLPKRSICRAHLVPPLFRMTLKRKLRVFQDLTTEKIVTQVLSESGITALQWQLRESYQPRNYCVQYRESDMDFVARLLEEEGIAYHFVHTEEELKTVFTDHNDLLKPITGNPQVVYNPIHSMAEDQEFVRSFRYEHRMTSGKVLLGDYNFKRPRLDLKGEAAGEDPSLEVYDFPGEFVEAGLGQRLANVRLQEHARISDVGHGVSDCIRMAPGGRFDLGGGSLRHGREELNQEYLLLQVVHTGHQGGVLEEEGDHGTTRYSNTFTVQPAAVPFRPPRVRPRPVVKGVLTASVVGPAGDEIYVDDHGRVKLRFHWDREDKSTSWVRVAQPWAGAGYGAQLLPRVGQEVVVAFIAGDPDRPVVVGRLYNGEQVVPYDLPTHKTRSTIRTMSSPAHAGGDTDQTTGLVDAHYANAGFNELCFEDAMGEEEVYLHAERDYNVVVENDQTTKIRHNRVEAIRQNQSLKVGNHLKVGVKQSSVQMAKRLVLEATDHLWVEVAGDGTMIHLTPSLVKMVGVDLLASATNVHDVKGGMVKVNNAAPLALFKSLPFSDKKEKKDLWLRFDINPEDSEYYEHKFTVESTDGSYSQTKTIKDDKIPGDEYLDLQYTGLDTSLNYSVKVEGPEMDQPKTLLENIPYYELYMASKRKGEEGLDELDYAMTE